MRKGETSFRESSNEEVLNDLSERLRRDVTVLATDIGERNVWLPERLAAAAAFEEETLAALGYRVHRQGYVVEGRNVCNLAVEIPGRERSDEIIVIGAHYDTRCGMRRMRSTRRIPNLPGTPGANDNASGVAGVNAFARHFAGARPARTLRLVAFVNEEHPFFQTPLMGSWVYARECRRKRERMVGMISLETLGFFSDRPNSQMYPFPYGIGLPRVGNFIAFLSDSRSRSWRESVVSQFRRATDFPSRALGVPTWIKRIGWSDDWAFWQEGYPAFSVTDTAFLRYRHYHTVDDTPDKLDYAKMAVVLKALMRAVSVIAEDDRA